MPNEQTIGERLLALLERSGRSMAAVSKAAGYKTPSGVQRYFSMDYDPPVLPLEIARKLATGFDGSAINRDEIFSLAGFPSEPEGKTVKFEGASDVRLARDLPIYGTALGSPREIEGEAIEQTFLDESTVIEYLPRPTVLQGRADVYGFYIQGSSMAPRFEEGELGFAETKRPPRVGDDVVVFLAGPDHHDGDRVNAVLIKRLVRRTAQYIELEQFNPVKTFRVEVCRVKHVHRVLPWREILS
ncbi:MAG: helix-turn-helix transcriptional regulator [Sphingomonas sp.]|uniref:S24 family peptidase n=1 Tax=Sphingomonas sp. TaxID=28214 RepID=UPI001B056E54|nr:S24 family peptidase [Sphingomonas sp.]MBO9624138.1 helix-turn-helix transcriptional regulator [Sphingomonas sp.]